MFRTVEEIEKHIRSIFISVGLADVANKFHEIRVHLFDVHGTQPAQLLGTRRFALVQIPSPRPLFPSALAQLPLEASCSTKHFIFSKIIKSFIDKKHVPDLEKMASGQ